MRRGDLVKTKHGVGYVKGFIYASNGGYSHVLVKANGNVYTLSQDEIRGHCLSREEIALYFSCRNQTVISQVGS